MITGIDLVSLLANSEASVANAHFWLKGHLPYRLHPTTNVIFAIW